MLRTQITKTLSVFCLGDVHSLVKETDVKREIIKHSEKCFNRTLNSALERQSTDKNNGN